MGIGSTVPLAIAMPAIINNRSPGANGTGTPLSSMKTSPAMTAIKRSPLRLEAEPNDALAVAREGVAPPRLLKFGIHRVAGVEHRLLDVMRKALGIGIGPEQLAGPRHSSPLVQGVHEMTRVRLMDRDVLEHRV